MSRLRFAGSVDVSELKAKSLAKGCSANGDTRSADTTSVDGEYYEVPQSYRYDKAVIWVSASSVPDTPAELRFR